MDRIVLIGFMGSGKTTLGRGLAARLRWDFIDLDSELEREHGASIAEQFARDGEAAFRAREAAVLARLASDPPLRTVIATGGGIVESDAAASDLRRLGPIVWLRIEADAAFARIAAQDGERPVLAGDWRARFEARQSRYGALADHVVDTHPDSEATSLDVLHRLVADEVK